MGLWEFGVKELGLVVVVLRSEVGLSIFAVGQKVDIQGITKGKGFQGTIKRHNFRMGDATHGQLFVLNRAGFLGAAADPWWCFRETRLVIWAL